jgi:polar amino acid transport system substrate-binding protein
MKLARIAPIAIAAGAALALTLTGCTNASEAPAKSGDTQSVTLPTEKVPALSADPALQALLPAEVSERGTLSIATDPTYAPFEVYADDNTTVVGLDADLGNALGQLLGLKVEFVPSGFDAIIPGLSSGKYDMAMSAFSVKPERLEQADMVVYHQSGSGIAVPKGNPEKLSMDPTTLCGRTIGAEKGTTQGMDILPEFSKECEASGEKPIDIQLFPGTDKALTALSSGRVAGVVSGATGLGYQAKISGAFDVAEGGDFDPRPTGAVLPKDSTLTPAIVAAMKQLVTEDAYRVAFEKWGIPANNMVTPDQVVPAL